MWKMFFSDYCEGKHLESRHARHTSRVEILHSMDCVLHAPRNFLGLIDGEGHVLQFMVNGDLSVRVEVASPSERGSYAKTADLPECLDLVRTLGSTVGVDDIPGLNFESW